MELTIEGVVRRINQPQEFASGFRKCEVHIEVENGKYTDVLPIEFIKEMADEASTLNIGERVKMRCFLGGREWDGGDRGWRAFMSLTVFKYELLDPKSIRETVIEKSKQTEPQADDMPW
jgi:hypothetical protein